jgi:uncharacterized protein
MQTRYIGSSKSPAVERRLEGLFNVSHLLRQTVGVSVTDRIDVEEPLVLDDLATRRISGFVRLIRTNFGILAKGKLRAIIELECDHCLEPYIATVQADFSEEFLPVIDVSTGRPVQSERTEEAFLISPDHVVDLTEATRQHLLLAIPMHKVCMEECLGLCPVCGTNRNVSDCGCKQQEENPFSAIAALLTDTIEPN